MDRSLYLTISERLGLVESLPTLPEVVSRVIELIDEPETTSELLAETVGSDPAIVARLMRVANSILYSGARGATDSLEEAIMRLGFAGVRDLVLTTGVIETFDPKVADFDYKGFWQHCATTGMAAGDLAGFAAKAGRPTSTPGPVAGPWWRYPRRCAPILTIYRSRAVIPGASRQVPGSACHSAGARSPGSAA